MTNGQTAPAHDSTKLCKMRHMQLVHLQPWSGWKMHHPGFAYVENMVLTFVSWLQRQMIVTLGPGWTMVGPSPDFLYFPCFVWPAPASSVPDVQEAGR